MKQVTQSRILKALDKCDRRTRTLREFLSNFERIATTYRSRYNKILNIQAQHKITGLKFVYIESTLISHGLSFVFFEERLRSIDSDLEVLQRYKPYVMQFFDDFARRTKLVPYYLSDGVWLPIEVKTIWAKSDLCDWANLSVDYYYISPQVITKHGYDEPHPESRDADDELHIELHLELGYGLDYKNACVLEFCIPSAPAIIAGHDTSVS